MPHTSSSLRDWLKYLFPGELTLLKGLAYSLPKDGVVVNIGAGGGTSAMAFLETRPDIHVFTIDIQKESSPFGCLEGELTALTEAGLAPSYRYQQIHGDSKEVGRCWQAYGYPAAHLVFIDGDHSYDGCAGDIKAWLPNINPGWYMAVHDYRKEDVFHNEPIEGAPHYRPWPGVDQAVDELLKPTYQLFKQVDTLVVYQL